MIRILLVAALALAPASYGLAGLASVDETVAAGFDLYQLDNPFFFQESFSEEGTAEGIIVPVEPFDDTPFGFFGDIEVVSNPLGSFDFGDGAGPVDVGLADTIIRRTAPATGLSDGFATVPIVVEAFSLRSIEPIELPGGGVDNVFIGLDPSVPSVGAYDFFFFPDDRGSVGDMSAQLTLNYQVRSGSADGPVIETNSVVLGSDFGSVPFSHFPEGLSPFSAPDVRIDGVNFFLDGQSQDEDFFQLGLPLPLFNFDDGPVDGEGDFRFFELAFEHANTDDPGDTANNPILPNGTQGVTFVFDEAPQRGWFDPPATEAYLYETDGNSNFVSVFLPSFALVPDADGQYLVSSVHGDVIVSQGSNYLFPSPVDSFVISGIDPAVDGGDPLAFPTFLQFDSFTNTFTQTPIPEPTSVTLVILGATLAASRRRV